MPRRQSLPVPTILAMRAMHATGASLSEIGARFNTTRMTARYYIHKNLTPAPRGCPPAGHQNLFEPWAEYTARKQKERAEAKAAALQVAIASQESD